VHKFLFVLVLILAILRLDLDKTMAWMHPVYVHSDSRSHLALYFPDISNLTTPNAVVIRSYSRLLERVGLSTDKFLPITPPSCSIIHNASYFVLFLCPQVSRIAQAPQVSFIPRPTKFCLPSNHFVCLVHIYTMSEKKGKGVTTSSEIPVRPPPRPSEDGDPTVYASAGTASDPSTAGPGVQHSQQYANIQGGQSLGGVNGSNPALGQQPNLHQTGGFQPYFQQSPFPSAGCYPQGSTIPVPHFGAIQLPYYQSNNDNNFPFINQPQPSLVSYTHASQPFFHYHIVRTISTPILHCHRRFIPKKNGRLW
jgi:hypothetical protein